MPMPNTDKNPNANLFDRFARFYDQDYRNYDVDIDLICELAQENAGPILELGCGTGRLLLPLALSQPDHLIIGVDISPALLSIAEMKLSSASVQQRVTLLKDDLCTFSLSRHDIRFAFCASNTFMHLNQSELQLAALHNVYNHLAPGGSLLIDLFNPDIARLLEISGVCELADCWYNAETKREVTKWSVRTLSLAEQLQETLFIYEEVDTAGQVTRTNCPFTIRFLWCNEAVLMLEQAGFVVEEIWGDFDLSLIHI